MNGLNTALSYQAVSSAAKLGAGIAVEFGRFFTGLHRSLSHNQTLNRVRRFEGR